MRPPPLAVRARRLALELGVEAWCRDEDGALLHVLTSGGRVRRAGEIGAGAGVGAAWIAAALPPGIPLFTAEPDAGRAAAVADLFADDPDVHVLHGDWREVLAGEAPFDLLFVADGRARDEIHAILGLAAPGCLVVMDDLSADRTGRDAYRERWLAHPQTDVVVVGTGGSAQALIAAVRG